jgi:hypothetical protein
MVLLELARQEIFAETKEESEVGISSSNRAFATEGVLHQN